MSNYDPNLVGAITDKGLYRNENEDALWQPDKTTPVEYGALYIVADGVGGQDHGGIAARMAVAVLSDAFYRARRQGQTITKALKASIEQANQAVFDEAKSNELRMGATVVTAVHHEGLLYIAYVGDSRAYMVTGAKLTPLTRDDSLVQQQLDAGVITPAEAAQHQFQNLVTQVLGNTLEIEVHLVEPRSFADRDTLLLCSDGLSGVVDPKAMLNIVENHPASEAASQLVQAAKEAGSQDNITAVVVTQSASSIPLVPMPEKVEKPEREWSIWLWAGVLIFFVVVTTLLWWWRGQDTTDEMNNVVRIDPTLVNAFIEGEATLLPEISVTPVISTTAVAENTLPTPEETSLEIEVIETIVPTATPSPMPTAVPALVGCVNPQILVVYVWVKEDLTLETCAAAVAPVYLDAGESVIILQPTPEALPGPQTCTEIDFIEVQSQLDDSIRGWVLETQILPEEECP